LGHDEVSPRGWIVKVGVEGASVGRRPRVLHGGVAVPSGRRSRMRDGGRGGGARRGDGRGGGGGGARGGRGRGAGRRVEEARRRGSRRPWRGRARPWQTWRRLRRRRISWEGGG
jgi:hypothetical protein